METKLVRFFKDDIIFTEGDNTREMYILRSGSVEVFINKNGRMVKITELGKAHYIGEMSFLSGIPRSATVIAKTDVIANMITPDILSDENLGISNWAVSIAKVLVKRILKTTKRVSSQLDQNGSAPGKESENKNGIEKFDAEYSGSSREGRIYLKGSLSAKGVEIIKNRLRLLVVKNIYPLVLDFSNVIDIDDSGLHYLLSLTKQSNIKIENVQLIKDKVLSIKGISDILISSKAPSRKIEKDENLIKQGDFGDRLYVVKNGSFSIFMETEEGEVFLDNANDGDVLGEMALIKQGPRSATVRADKPSTVYTVDIREFYNNIYNIPVWFMDLIQGLVQRLRDTNELLEHIENEKNKKEEDHDWFNPFSIIIDDKHPGEYALRGNLIFSYIPFIKQLIRNEMQKGTKNIVFHFYDIKQIDRDSIESLLNIYSQLKRKGITLDLTGPQDSILELFRQYHVD